MLKQAIPLIIIAEYIVTVQSTASACKLIQLNIYCSNKTNNQHDRENIGQYFT